MRRLWALLGILLASGCQAAGSQLEATPWWRLGLTAPDYMTVWVETVEVEDINEKLFRRVSGGVAGSNEPEDDTESARGWHGISGSGMPAVGADLPKRIFVRWQSIVEPQTYRVWVDIPEEARQIMRKSTTALCAEDRNPEPMGGGGRVNLGLAPGGIVQVWVRDECLHPIKVARAQAEVEPLGPHQGNSGGNYYPQSEASKRYIERFGIPYGSW